jgi:hypothetical protein
LEASKLQKIRYTLPFQQDDLDFRMVVCGTTRHAAVSKVSRKTTLHMAITNDSPEMDTKSVRRTKTDTTKVFFFMKTGTQLLL